MLAAQRKDVVTEVREALEIISSARQGPVSGGEVRAVTRKPRDRTPERLIKVHEVVENIRNTITKGGRPEGAIEREELVAEIRKLRADIGNTSCISGTLSDQLKTANPSGAKAEDIALEMGRQFKLIDQRLGTLDAGLSRLQDTAGHDPVLTKVGELGEALQNKTEELQKITGEGLELVREEIITAAAMRPVGLNLQDELAMEERTCPTHLEENIGQGWKTARGGRRRGKSGTEPLNLEDFKQRGHAEEWLHPRSLFDTWW